MDLKYNNNNNNVYRSGTFNCKKKQTAIAFMRPSLFSS